MSKDEEKPGDLLVTGFELGDSAFGVDAHLVQEVVKVGEITRVHDAPPSVVGIRNLRGHIVTVVDLAEHLGLGSVEIGPETRLLIMEHEGEVYGFLVDGVTDALNLEAESVLPPPESIDPDLRLRLRGVFRQGDKLTTILDAGNLFAWNDEG